MVMMPRWKIWHTQLSAGRNLFLGARSGSALISFPLLHFDLIFILMLRNRRRVWHVSHTHSQHSHCSASRFPTSCSGKDDNNEGFSHHQDGMSTRCTFKLQKLISRFQIYVWSSSATGLFKGDCLPYSCREKEGHSSSVLCFFLSRSK